MSRPGGQMAQRDFNVMSEFKGLVRAWNRKDRILEKAGRLNQPQYPAGVGGKVGKRVHSKKRGNSESTAGGESSTPNE